MLISSKIAKKKCILYGYKINMARRKNANDMKNKIVQYGLLPWVNFLFNYFLHPYGPFQIMQSRQVVCSYACRNILMKLRVTK